MVPAVRRMPMPMIDRLPNLSDATPHGFWKARRCKKEHRGQQADSRPCPCAGRTAMNFWIPVKFCREETGSCRRRGCPRPRMDPPVAAYRRTVRGSPYSLPCLPCRWAQRYQNRAGTGNDRAARISVEEELTSSGEIIVLLVSCPPVQVRADFCGTGAQEFRKKQSFS